MMRSVRDDISHHSEISETWPISSKHFSRALKGARLQPTTAPKFTVVDVSPATLNFIEPSPPWALFRCSCMFLSCELQCLSTLHHTESVLTNLEGVLQWRAAVACTAHRLDAMVEMFHSRYITSSRSSW